MNPKLFSPRLFVVDFISQYCKISGEQQWIFRKSIRRFFLQVSTRDLVRLYDAVHVQLKGEISQLGIVKE